MYIELCHLHDFFLGLIQALKTEQPDVFEEWLTSGSHGESMEGRAGGTVRSHPGVVPCWFMKAHVGKGDRDGREQVVLVLWGLKVCFQRNEFPLLEVFTKTPKYPA